jgi:hypothetical protein
MLAPHILNWTRATPSSRDGDIGHQRCMTGAMIRGAPRAILCRPTLLQPSQREVPALFFCCL